MRMASCAARTLRRPRRSRASQYRYCRLAPWATSCSTFDMHFELPPESVEIPIEFRSVARLEGGEAAAAACRESDRMIRLYLSRTAREHDDALRHADRFRN